MDVHGWVRDTGVLMARRRLEVVDHELRGKRAGCGRCQTAGVWSESGLRVKEPWMVTWGRRKWAVTELVMGGGNSSALPEKESSPFTMETLQKETYAAPTSASGIVMLHLTFAIRVQLPRRLPEAVLLHLTFATRVQPPHWLSESDIHLWK